MAPWAGGIGVSVRMMLHSIGDRVEPGEYQLHSRFEHACNFLKGQRLICVVDTSIGAGPMNIVLTRIPAQAANTLSVFRDSLLVGERRIPFTQQHRYQSALRIHCSRPERFRQNLAVFRACLAETAPPESLAFLIDGSRSAPRETCFAQALAARVVLAVHELLYGDLLAGVAALRGCGPGLTPSGDDFIAGVLIGLHVFQQISDVDFRGTMAAIAAAAAGGNVFSNNFLNCAHKGLVSERVKSLVAIIAEGSSSDVPAATERLLAIGSTSGADLAVGLYMTLLGRGEFAARYQKALCASAKQISMPSFKAFEVGA